MRDIPPFFVPATKEDPLNALRELDAEVADRCGQLIENALGFDYATGCFMSRREFVVCVNPPELPA